MTPEEEYELLKKNFILQASYHLKLLEELEYEDFSQVGTRGILASARLESASSYGKLVKLISEVNVKLPGSSSAEKK